MSTNVLIINSADRVSGTSSNFKLRLPFTIENATKLKMNYFRGANIMYNITAKNNSISFTASATTYTASIPAGSYTMDLLTTAIAAALNSQFSNGFTATYSALTSRLTIAGSASTTINWAQSLIAELLGFSATTTGTSHTGPNAPDLAKPYFIYISLPQFDTVGMNSAGNGFCFYIPINTNTGDFIEHKCKQEMPLHTRGIPSILHVKVSSSVADLDLNTADWSAAFEVEKEYE